MKRRGEGTWVPSSIEGEEVEDKKYEAEAFFGHKVTLKGKK